MALRRLNAETLVYELGPIKVYRDDLKEVIDLLASLASDIHVRVDEYEIDDVDDLALLANKGITRVQDCVVSAEGGRVGLRIGGRRAVLAVRDPDLPWRGAAAEVQRILKRCRGPRFRAFVETRNRAEAPEFWHRKKDDVYIAAISGVVFLLIGYLIGHYYR